MPRSYTVGTRESTLLALTPQERYAREVASAKALGFATPYDRRKARAKERGFSSPRTERTASEQRRNTPRDYALERERATIRARSRGFKSLSEQRRYNKQAGTDKAKALAYFGISENKFNTMRRENRHWSKEYPQLQWTAINTYDIDRDKAVHDWSLRRVGYIVYFNRAIVNPKTNYDSVSKPFYRPNGRKGRKMDLKNATPEQRDAQFNYLVQYTGLMQVDEFESRYGARAVAK